MQEVQGIINGIIADSIDMEAIRVIDASVVQFPDKVLHGQVGECVDETLTKEHLDIFRQFCIRNGNVTLEAVAE